MNRINNNKNTRKPKNNDIQENKKIKERHTKKTKVKEAEVKKKKNPIVRFFKKLFIIILLLVIIFGILFYLKVKQNGGGVQGILCTVFGQSVEEIKNLEPISVLLLGVSEDLDSKLTDTIILCTYNPKNQSASMLSIPRDTFIGKNKNTAKGRDKINYLYSKGVKNTVKAVSDITGVDIDYYVVVNNNALIEMVDIVGGIDFDVPIDMNYDDPTQDLHIHLKSGMQKINGEKAEQLLRFRHNNDGSSYPAEYGDNDFGRMKTQRSFITETIKQTLDIKNIIKARKIMNTVFDNIETNLSKEEITKYIPCVADFSPDNITSYQLPGESEKCNNLWFFIHNKKETKKLVKELETNILN